MSQGASQGAGGAVPDTVAVFRGGSRKPLVLAHFAATARRLGAGGAGTVYQAPALPDRAVKLYHDPATARAHEAKVRAMLERPPTAILRAAGGIVQVAWPEAEVRSVDGRFLGMVMPFIDFAQAWSLGQVMNAALRRRKGIPESLRLRLFLARNLASVLGGLHRAGHYAIDLKPRNILAYNRPGSHGNLALVDCDGFQINHGGQRFDAALASDGYITPKVAVPAAGGGEPGFDGTAINRWALEQDNYALAVIIFELLNGCHPYQGRPLVDHVPPSRGERAMAAGRYYAFGLEPNPLIEPPESSLHRRFAEPLLGLFERAFTGRTAPMPAEWLQALDPLKGDEQACPHDPDHWKLGPACAICGATGPARLAPPVAKPGQLELVLPEPASADPVPSALPASGPSPGPATPRPASRSALGASGRRRRRRAGLAVAAMLLAGGVAVLALRPAAVPVARFPTPRSMVAWHRAVIRTGPAAGASAGGSVDPGHPVRVLGTAGPGGRWLALADGGYVASDDLRPAVLKLFAHSDRLGLDMLADPDDLKACRPGLGLRLVADSPALWPHGTGEAVRLAGLALGLECPALKSFRAVLLAKGSDRPLGTLDVRAGPKGWVPAR